MFVLRVLLFNLLQLVFSFVKAFIYATLESFLQLVGTFSFGLNWRAEQVILLPQNRIDVTNLIFLECGSQLVKLRNTGLLDTLNLANRCFDSIIAHLTPACVSVLEFPLMSGCLLVTAQIWAVTFWLRRAYID